MSGNHDIVENSKLVKFHFQKFDKSLMAFRTLCVKQMQEIQFFKKHSSKIFVGIFGRQTLGWLRGTLTIKMGICTAKSTSVRYLVNSQKPLTLDSPPTEVIVIKT
jgi:hypothetical protein